MFKNNLKIALRNIRKNKFFSILNIIGLSVGLSAAFVIGAIIYYDMTFDTFHNDKDRIFRVTTKFTSPDGNFYNSGVSVPLAQELSNLNMAELETVAPFLTAYPLHVENKKQDLLFKNPKFVVYANDSYFQLFNYTWLAGSQQDALNLPHTVVLSEERAKKYFPNQNLGAVLGRTIVYNDSIPTVVTGVVANFTERTDLVFEEFISLSTANSQDMTNAVVEAAWNSTTDASQLFIKLSKSASYQQVQRVLTDISKEHEDAGEAAIGNTASFYMQPLADLHFDTNYYTYDFSRDKASLPVLRNLALIAIFLLALGCINFINLNTAQASQRAKEIGIRKTLGSSKKQLVIQFLGETFLLTVAAGILSVVISKGLLQVFRDYIPAGVTLELYASALPLLGITVLLLVVTLFSGFYPALVLSGYKPVSVLKTQGVIREQRSGLRRYLSIFQFTIAQLFVIATFLVGKQLNYVMKKDMGFKTEAIAYFRTPWSSPSEEKKQRLVKDIERLPQVSKVTLGGQPPASFSTNSIGVSFKDDQKVVHTSLQQIFGNEAYFKMYELQLLAGRLPLNDTIQEFVVNETYLKKLGITNPEDIIGKIMKSDEESLPIVGVMKDFNQRSLKSGVKPMAFTGDSYRSWRSQFNTVHFQLATKDSSQWPQTIAEIEAIWNQIYPSSEFATTFMDTTIEAFYKQERKVSVLLSWATGLSILISCLGLFGLVLFTTQKRVKELGIRKVLGASLVQLNLLLSKEFLVVVGVAFVIAAPIGWWAMHNWLQDFAYKTELSWWVFVCSGLMMLVIAFIIVSFRTIAAAKANPVTSLRTE